MNVHTFDTAEPSTSTGWPDPTFQPLVNSSRSESAQVIYLWGAPGSGQSYYLRHVADYFHQQDLPVQWSAVREDQWTEEASLTSLAF